MKDKDAQLMMESLSEAWKDQWPADQPTDAVGARVFFRGRYPDESMVVVQDNQTRDDGQPGAGSGNVEVKPEDGSRGALRTPIVTKQDLILLDNQPQYERFFDKESLWTTYKNQQGRDQAQRKSDELNPLGYGPGVSPSVGKVRLDSIKPL